MNLAHSCILISVIVTPVIGISKYIIFVNIIYSANICCGQTAGWIQMPLGTEIDLGQGDIALDGDPAPQKGGTAPPTFWPMSIVANSWMDQDTTWYGGKPRRRRHCVRWEPSSTPKERGSLFMQFPPYFYFRFGRRLGVGASGALFIAVFCNRLCQILHLSTITVAFRDKRRLLTLFPILPKLEVVFNDQMVEDRSIFILLLISQVNSGMCL